MQISSSSSSTAKETEDILTQTNKEEISNDICQRGFLVERDNGEGNVSMTDDNDDDDEDSILSGPKWRDYWPDSTHRAHRRLRYSQLTSLQVRWEECQRQFAKRDHLLQRIGVGKSKAFLRQIRERELLVRRQIMEDLLQNSSAGGGIDNGSGSTSSETAVCSELLECLKATEASLLLLKTSSSSSVSFFQKALDGLVFEMNSFVPSVYALVVHTVALNCIYDGINASLHIIGKNLDSSGDRRWIDYSFGSATVILGILCMRCTGDLYWWLSDSDYDLVKFDFHNRQRLRFWDARILATVRDHSGWRGVLFMLGYHLCYISMTGNLFWIEQMLGQGDEALANLPSNRFAKDYGVCHAIREESFCTRSCQDEIVRREREYLFLKTSDMEYTATTLATFSYEAFWYRWTHNDGWVVDETAHLIMKYDHMIYCFVSTITAILILRIYGFRFWVKY